MDAQGYDKLLSLSVNKGKWTADARNDRLLQRSIKTMVCFSYCRTACKLGFQEKKKRVFYGYTGTSEIEDDESMHDDITLADIPVELFRIHLAPYVLKNPKKSKINISAWPDLDPSISHSIRVDKRLDEISCYEIEMLFRRYAIKEGIYPFFYLLCCGGKCTMFYRRNHVRWIGYWDDVLEKYQHISHPPSAWDQVDKSTNVMHMFVVFDNDETFEDIEKFFWFESEDYEPCSKEYVRYCTENAIKDKGNEGFEMFVEPNTLVNMDNYYHVMEMIQDGSYYIRKKLNSSERTSSVLKKSARLLYFVFRILICVLFLLAYWPLFQKFFNFT